MLCSCCLHFFCACRVPELDGGALFMDALRQWAKELFMCSACAQHFQVRQQLGRLNPEP